VTKKSKSWIDWNAFSFGVLFLSLGLIVVGMEWQFALNANTGDLKSKNLGSALCATGIIAMIYGAFFPMLKNMAKKLRDKV
jgi:hypothetical protein